MAVISNRHKFLYNMTISFTICQFELSQLSFRFPPHTIAHYFQLFFKTWFDYSLIRDSSLFPPFSLLNTQTLTKPNAPYPPFTIVKPSAHYRVIHYLPSPPLCNPHREMHRASLTFPFHSLAHPICHSLSRNVALTIAPFTIRHCRHRHLRARI